MVKKYKLRPMTFEVVCTQEDEERVVCGLVALLRRSQERKIRELAVEVKTRAKLARQQRGEAERERAE